MNQKLTAFDFFTFNLNFAAVPFYYNIVTQT